MRSSRASSAPFIRGHSGSFQAIHQSALREVTVGAAPTVTLERALSAPTEIGRSARADAAIGDHRGSSHRE
jgi:hypothetical protein